MRSTEGEGLATTMTSTKRLAGAGRGRAGIKDRTGLWGLRARKDGNQLCSDGGVLSPSLCPLRGAFSYLRRVVERSSGLEFAAKFIPSQAKPKASARREARLLARLQHDCVLYFHEAFERRRGLVIVTELYPGTRRG